MKGKTFTPEQIIGKLRFYLARAKRLEPSVGSLRSQSRPTTDEGESTEACRILEQVRSTQRHSPRFSAEGEPGHFASPLGKVF
jgi:hypothetical protein